MVVVEDVGAGDGPASGSPAAALDHVANRPIIGHVIDALGSAGVQDVIVVSSIELSDEVRRSLSSNDHSSSARIRYVSHDAPVTVADGVELALPLIGEEPCLVHVAHGMLAAPLKPLVQTIRPNSPDVVVVVHHGAATEDRLTQEAKRTLRIAEIDERAALGMSGVWLFGEGALRSIGSAPWRMSAGRRRGRARPVHR